MECDARVVDICTLQLSLCKGVGTSSGAISESIGFSPATSRVQAGTVGLTLLLDEIGLEDVLVAPRNPFAGHCKAICGRSRVIVAGTFQRR